ncbi:MAG: outer membrane lipoprotein-sorting protein [Deltaproteobacteria bacterium]|nr:outer membrane lipoprotein-sorting protein [Deltaproteobacteria bacterium]
MHIRLAFLCVLLFALLGPAPAWGGDGLAVMKRVDGAMRSQGEEMTVQMQLANAAGSTETRTFKMWTRSPVGKPAKTLIRFESPASIARTALLTVTRTGGGQDNWLYVPALGQTRRVAPQDRSESFVQSDFTIEDLTVTIDAENRVYTVLGQVDCGGRACTQVEDKPANDAAAKQSGYGRVVLYIDDERAVVHRVDFYDKSDALLKVLQADGLVQVGDNWRFDRAVVTNVQKGSRTVMTVISRAHGASVDDSIFSASSLDAL